MWLSYLFCCVRWIASASRAEQSIASISKKADKQFLLGGGTYKPHYTTTNTTTVPIVTVNTIRISCCWCCAVVDVVEDDENTRKQIPFHSFPEKLENKWKITGKKHIQLKRDRAQYIDNTHT